MIEALIRFCAPTLAALKTAGAFTYPFHERWVLDAQLHRVGGLLAPKGVILSPLRVKDGRALLYAFRPAMLDRDLSDEIAQGILSAYKYPEESLASQLRYLAGRLGECDRFPHEMGLFLGYPPLDVLGFILNGGTRYKSVGLWKVYSNEAEASRRFSLYKRCTARLLRRYYSGEGIEDIAVFL